MAKVYFAGATRQEQLRYRQKMDAIEVEFVSDLSRVPEHAEVVCVTYFHKVDERFLQSHPHLKAVVTRTTSRDHIDEAACQRHRIRVLSAEDFGENAVAEHVFALLLALTRKLRESYEAVRATKVDTDALRGQELFGRTLAVIGCGRVGLHVIRIASGFRMRVLGCDSAPHPFLSELLNFEYVDLETALKEADFLSLHVPLNPHTRGLLNREKLMLCRPGVIIINTARGGLIDLDAALELLKTGHLGGLGLDVLDDESVFREGAAQILSRQIVERLRVSKPESPRSNARLDEIRAVMRNQQLLEHSRVVFTPHTAYNSEQALEKICCITVRNLLTCLKKTSPRKPPQKNKKPASTQ